MVPIQLRRYTDLPRANHSVIGKANYIFQVNPIHSDHRSNAGYSAKAYLFDFPIHKPYFQLSKENQELVWTGNSYFTGINDFFKKIEAKNYKIQNRVLLSRYRGKTSCTLCKGSRLKKDAHYVKITDKSLPELLQVSIDELSVFFNQLKLDK